MEPHITTAEIEDFLGKTWAFDQLEPSHLQILSRHVRVRELTAGQILWLQGQEITFFTIVYRGQIRSLRRSSSGSEKLVSLLPRAHHFGLAEMITGASSAVTLIADEATTILTMDQRSLKNELLSNADICYRLMQTMARAIFRLQSELEKVSFETAHTRLARVLLKKSGYGHLLEGRPSGNRITAEPKSRVIPRVSHEQLAVQIGVSRETVSRVLGEFKKSGLIDTGYRQIEVRDPHGLAGFVEEEI